MTKAKQNDTLNGILYEMTNFIRKKKWLNWIRKADCAGVCWWIGKFIRVQMAKLSFTN